MALWPSPSFQIKKSRRPNHHTIPNPDGSKRHRSASVSPSQSSIDVADHFSLALRHRTPLVERAIHRRSGHQAINMSMVKQFEADVFSR
jgi:hypothetical protein